MQLVSEFANEDLFFNVALNAGSRSFLIVDEIIFVAAKNAVVFCYRIQSISGVRCGRAAPQFLRV